MDHNQENRLMELFLDFGEAMLGAGAEIGRVESSLSYLCSAFGALRSDVFAITSSIVLTVQFAPQQDLTRSRRIVSSGGTDYEKLRMLSDLSRRCVRYPITVEELEAALRKIVDARPHRRKLYLGSILASGAFCLFFGGTVWESALSALFGIFICFLQKKLAPRCPNQVFFLFLTSLICGLGICGLSALLPRFDTAVVIIGDIMLLVPGIAITEAVRDMLIGDTISGSTRLLESLLRAGALASGFMLAMAFFGRA